MAIDQSHPCIFSYICKVIVSIISEQVKFLGIGLLSKLESPIPSPFIPWQVLQEHVNEGKVGSLTDQFISFMGHIYGTLIETFVRETSVAAADKVKQMQADIALLVPS